LKAHCDAGTFDGIRKDIYSILVSFISCFIAISCWRPIGETFMLRTIRIANKNEGGIMRLRLI